MVKILMESHDNHLKVIYTYCYYVSSGLGFPFLKTSHQHQAIAQPTGRQESIQHLKLTLIKNISNFFGSGLQTRRQPRIPKSGRIRAFRVVHLHTIRDSKTHSHPPWRWGSKPWWIAANCCGLVFLIQNGRGLLNVFLAKKVLYLYYQILVNWLLSLHIFFQTCGSIFMCIIYTIIYIRLTISAKPQHVTFPAGP